MHDEPPEQENAMKTIASALIALSILAGLAAPASAANWPDWARDSFARSHPSS
jgi:hypothetical protein